MRNLTDNLLPDQIEGTQLDVSEVRTFSSLTQAQQCFNIAAKKLLDVNNWGKISGLSDFQLHDQTGSPLFRLAREGDFIRINIPGPGPRSGDGFDWVIVEKIQHENDGDVDFILMQVRPSINPTRDEKTIAHFLNSKATSSFIIRRNRIKVHAEEHARNEKANIAEGGFMDKGRNLIVGLAAKLGLSYPQWKLLVKSFLDGKC